VAIIQAPEQFYVLKLQSVRMCQRGSLLDGFPWCLILRFLWKSVENLKIWLKLCKNIGHFTWGPKYVLLF